MFKFDLDFDLVRTGDRKFSSDLLLSFFVNFLVRGGRNNSVGVLTIFDLEGKSESESVSRDKLAGL